MAGGGDELVRRSAIDQGRLMEELREHLRLVEKLPCSGSEKVVVVVEEVLPVALNDAANEAKHSSKMKAVMRKMINKVHDTRHSTGGDDGGSGASVFHLQSPLQIRLPSECEQSSGLSSKTYNCLVANYGLRRSERKLVCCDSPLLVELGQRYVIRVQVNTAKHGLGRWTTVGLHKQLSNAHTSGRCLLYRRTLVVTDRSKQTDKRLTESKQITFVDEPPFSHQWSQRWLNEFYCQPKYLRQSVLASYTGADDALQVSCQLEPVEALVNSFSTEAGVLNWTVDNLSVRLQEERLGERCCLYSPYFYTSPRGYRVRCRLYLNGDSLAVGSHVSIFLDFLCGRWDDQLPSSLDRFPHTTTFTLVDQCEHRRHHVRQELNTEGFVTDLVYDFVPHSVLFAADSHFTKSDALQLTVAVQPHSNTAATTTTPTTVETSHL